MRIVWSGLALILLLSLPGLSEIITLEKAKIRFTLPEGYQELSLSETGGTWIKKKTREQISLSKMPATTMSTPADWLESARRRAIKNGCKVTDLKIRGAVGAFMARDKNAAKAPFWGRITIYTQDGHFTFTFMGDPKQLKQTESRVQKLASSVRLLKAKNPPGKKK